jgi:TonB family protein
MTLGGIVAIAAFMFGCGSRVRAPSRTAQVTEGRDTTALAYDTLFGGARVYRESEVDRPARAILTGQGPRYPGALKTSDIEGAVVMQFIVDPTGSIEARSIHLVSSSHHEFTMTVVEYLRSVRYTPATRAGQPVRAWVRQKFEFRLGSR